VIVGTTFEIEGLENLPDGSYILAPKHQSFWDTYALLPWLKDPVYILKRELMWIPLFGWYAKKQRMIPVDRGARGKVMVEVLKRTKEELSTAASSSSIPRAPAARRAQSRSINTASPACTATLTSPSCRLPCIPVSSGRGGAFVVIPVISK
jgi:1-acyl-sn-glycerol-3-phosphate acyltransferase